MNITKTAQGLAIATLAVGLLAAPGLAHATPPPAHAPAPAATSANSELPTAPPHGHDTQKLQWYAAVGQAGDRRLDDPVH